MNRKILWKSMELDEIELVYEKAKQDNGIGMLLEQLENQALKEAKENISLYKTKSGIQLTSDKFDGMEERGKERVIRGLGNQGISEMKAEYDSFKIIITLSNLIVKVQACTVFSILNRIEKLDGSINILNPKWTLELQIPHGGKKGWLQWEMMIAKLYPWLSVIETTTNTVAITSEAHSQKVKKEDPFVKKMSTFCEYNEVYELAKAELETAIKNQFPFMREWKDNLPLNEWNGLNENDRFIKILSVGVFSIVLSNCICVDFSAQLPNCIAIALLYLAENKGLKKQIIDAGDRPDPGKYKLADALSKLLKCCDGWECTIVNPYHKKIEQTEKTPSITKTVSDNNQERKSFWKRLFGK